MPSITVTSLWNREGYPMASDQVQATKNVRCDACAFYKKTREPYYKPDFPREHRCLGIFDGECTAPVPGCIVERSKDYQSHPPWMRNLLDQRGVIGDQGLECAAFKPRVEG